VVLLPARLDLARVEDLARLAMQSLLAAAGERLDLLDLVVVERPSRSSERRKRLTSAVVTSAAR
jgi:hypothetical protein